MRTKGVRRRPFLLVAPHLTSPLRPRRCTLAKGKACLSILKSGPRIYRQSFRAVVPVQLEVPEPMIEPVRGVFAGEYEAGFSGTNLTILDIGANVGAFALWADMRWPGSRIIACEPHPETFAILQRNVAHRPGIECLNAAVTPGPGERGTLWSRHAGDGESGLMTYMGDTFSDLGGVAKIEVDLLHPSRLPRADIVKCDVEGAEAEIVLALDLSRTGLVLVEFQNDRNRTAIKQGLAEGFEIVAEDAFAWSGLLEHEPNYRRALADDHYGHLVLRSRDRALGGLTEDTTTVERPQSSLALKTVRRLRQILG